jgi:broad specificity phosphatase PhoE
LAGIPVSLLSDLERIPRDRPVTLLMRHSARHPIIDPAEPFHAMLTEDGIRLAEDLGKILGASFAPGRLMSAPVNRCKDTVAAIARGAGWSGEVCPQDALSHPFIAPAWDRLYLGEANGTLPTQVRVTLALLLGSAGRPPALDLAVTHDTILGAVVGYLLKAPVMKEFWPDYLEGTFAWREDSSACFLWRGQAYRFAKGSW